MKESGKPATKSKKLKYLKSENGWILFAAPAGEYSLEMPWKK